MKKKMIRLLSAVTVALVLAVVFEQSAYAQAPGPWNPGWTFENCLNIWWYQECWTVFVPDPSGDGAFEAMYRFCQLIGLCP